MIWVINCRCASLIERERDTKWLLNQKDKQSPEEITIICCEILLLNNDLGRKWSLVYALSDIFWYFHSMLLSCSDKFHCIQEPT